MKRASLLIALFLFTSVVQAQPSKETINQNYQKLFTIAGGFFEKLPKTCKTEACATLAANGAKVIAEGQDKHARGVLVAEDRAAWHAKLESSLHASIVELQTDILRKRGGKTVPTAAFIRPPCVKSANLPDQCGLCYDVLEQVAEICALYAFVSPEAAGHGALICLGWAALNFGGCVNNYCGGW